MTAIPLDTQARVLGLSITAGRRNAGADRFHHVRRADGRQIAVFRLDAAGQFVHGWVQNPKGRSDFTDQSQFQTALGIESAR